MKSTVRIKAPQITKDWQVLDAAGVPLGRLATQAATLLRGKHKPTFEPHLDGGDFVIVVNAGKIKVSGTKATTKLYYRHSGYPGGLRSRTLEDELARFPDRVVRQAVWGMLPKGPLGKALLRHLKVYAGPDHPHQSQVVGSERARADRSDAIAWTPPHLRHPKQEEGRLEEESLEPEGLAAPPADDPTAVADQEAEPLDLEEDETAEVDNPSEDTTAHSDDDERAPGDSEGAEE